MPHSNADGHEVKAARVAKGAWPDSAVYLALPSIVNNSCTTVPSIGSICTPDGSRGRSGADRYPYGDTVHGNSAPAFNFICRPRRMRSAIRNRSYSATAPRICRSLIMRILAHRAVQEFHVAAAALPFFDQHHLMHVVARQSIGTGEQDPIESSAF